MEARSYNCTARLIDSLWTPEGCNPAAESDAVAQRVATYLKLRELSGSSYNSYGFCLSEADENGQRDADPAVLFLLKGAPNPIVGRSSCTWVTSEFRGPEGRSARALHVESVEQSGGAALVLAWAQGDTWMPRYFACQLVRDGDQWVAQSCDSTEIAPSAGDETDLRVALYRNLISLEGTVGTPSCLSEGAWSDPKDAPAAVRNRLSASGGEFLAASECRVGFEGTFSPEDAPARLLHIVGLEWDGAFATADLAYQRSGLDVAGYICNLERRGEEWSFFGCSRNGRVEMDSRSVALYHALGSARPFGDPGAYCLSHAFPAGLVPDDPREAVLFRMGGGESSYLPVSECVRRDDDWFTKDGESAHGLHIVTTSSGAGVAVYSGHGDDRVVFSCALSDDSGAWTASCTQKPVLPLTNDEIGVMTAAFGLLLEWVLPHPQWPKDAFCSGIALDGRVYMHDIEPAVMERLAAIDARFVHGSECRPSEDLRETLTGLMPVSYRTATSNPVSALLVTSVRWEGTVAVVDITFSRMSRDTRGFTCRWEKAGGEWEFLSCSGGWIT